MIRDELLQAAYAQRDTALTRIANISNDTLILNRQIIEAQARVDALHDEWEVLQNQDTAARIAARAPKAHNKILKRIRCVSLSPETSPH